MAADVARAEHMFCAIPPQANQWTANLRLDMSGCTGSFLAMTTRLCEST
jgi:hypothetical protein